METNTYKETGNRTVLDTIHPDDLSPRDALELIYRLKDARKG